MRNMTGLIPHISRSLLTSLPHILLLWSLTAVSVTRTADTYDEEYFPNEVAEEEPEIKPCSDNQQVCTSLFRYDAQTILQEGQYCACHGCNNPQWDEEDGMSITWYHHSRADRMVQYRFCERVVPKYSCKEDRDVAVIIRATTNGWNPTIKKIWCSCPGGKYVLKGWTKVHEGEQTYWEYTYTCKKVLCELDKPCVRRYMNAEREKAKGYRFQCSCPEGQMCPLSKGPSNKYDEVIDESGQVYTNGYCKKLKAPPVERPPPEGATSTQHAEHAHAEP